MLLVTEENLPAGRLPLILVTGAAGALGSLIAARLSERTDVVLGTRAPDRLHTALPVRAVDFDDPRTLDTGFADVRLLLLISAGHGEDDCVIARHQRAIEAAERSGVSHVVYTSLTAAGDHLPYALPHRWTERRLQQSAMDWTILRNGLYAELIAQITAPSPDGILTAPLADGQVAAVTREDLAEAAVRVVTEAPEHAGRTYELVGEHAVGGQQLARAHGERVSYAPLELAAVRDLFTAAGTPPFQVPMLIGTYSAIAAGFLGRTGTELRDLLGRAPRPALEVIAGAG
ncbi:NAD(P)H-binding protein [Streptomyces sp. NPDC006879]|uniref:NAD(P)H-binding protein n=1 Tax=Streptomyces sp. NPDC006879 TaxID=3364767 RepID=UPI0036848262